MSDGESSGREEQDQEQLLTRRAALARAGRWGLALGTAPLVGWLAGCGSPTASTGTAATAPRRATPSPTATPDVRPITLAITGDIMLGRSITPQMLATGGDPTYPFGATGAYLRAFDLTIGNLECVVSALGSPVPDKPFTFRADPIGFARLATAGFDILSLANNHSGDYGKVAFVDMLEHLPTHGFTPLGGGHTLAEARTPVVRALHGTTVGLLNYCEIDPYSFAATATTPGHAWLSADALRADIPALRSKVDFLITFMHWGIEYQPQEDSDQQTLAHLAVDLGADLVVGAHPHVIQPNEMYAGKPIIYSLGNFVFDEMWSDDVRTGNVLALTVERGKLLSWSLRESYIVGNTGAPVWK